MDLTRAKGYALGATNGMMTVCFFDGHFCLAGLFFIVSTIMFFRNW